MYDRHRAHWPAPLPRHLTLPQANLFYNAEVSAARFPAVADEVPPMVRQDDAKTRLDVMDGILVGATSDESEVTAA